MKGREEKKLRLEWIDPDQLAEHPENWKTHPETQMEGLSSVIDQVGWAGALLLNERTGRLLDGHARKKLDPKLYVDGRAPVLVGSWSEEEERLILATLDPIGSLAQANEEALNDLLAQLDVQSADVQALLDQLSVEDSDPAEPDLSTTTFSYQSQYGVIVTCEDEAHQQTVYEALIEEGYECKVVVV